jgi:hypothetical protein
MQTRKTPNLLPALRPILTHTIRSPKQESAEILNRLARPTLLSLSHHLLEKKS